MNQSMIKQSFSSTNDQLKYKIILVGDSHVGKSTLFMKFILENAFTLDLAAKVTMIDFKVKEVILPQQAQAIKLYIWDTAGQQKYRSIVSTYFKGCHGVLLIFDLSSLQSFQNIKKQWYNLVKKKAESATILLVGNKSDLPHQVDKSQIDNFIKQNHLKYVETSVKDNKNVNEAFITITRIINAKRHEMEKPQSFYLKNKQIKHSQRKNCCLFN